MWALTSQAVQRSDEPVLLRERALKSIRQLILAPDNRRLRDGTWTSERNIADELEISRTPVREALAVLEQMGIVEQQLRVGVRVRQICLEEVEDALRIREGIETAAAERLGENDKTKRDLIEKLESTVEHMRKSQSDIQAFMEIDTTFHCALVSGGGLASRAVIVQSLRDIIHLHRLQQHKLPSSLDIEAVIHEHDSILNALKSDAGMRAAVVSEHLRNTLGRLRLVTSFQAAMNTLKTWVVGDRASLVGSR